MNSWVKPLTYLSALLSHNFFEAVELFEEVVELTLKDPSSDKDLGVYKGKNEDLVHKKMKELSPGHNLNVAVELVIIRIINSSHLSYLLAVEDNPPLTSDSFYCLIVVSPKCLVQKWIGEVGLNMSLLVKEPYLEYELANQMSVCVARLENIVLQPVQRWKNDYHEVKAKGNEMFGNKDYFTALSLYEYALTSLEFTTDKRARAILYSNAAACLHEMKLYSQSIRYSDLSIRIDANYSKAYFRKINSLLEKGDFMEVPTLMTHYIDKVEIGQLADLNLKFTKYISNSRGFFNWSEMLHAENQELCFSDYYSQKIEIKKVGCRNVYVAKEKIEPYEILIFAKPIFFYKSSESIESLEKMYTQIQKRVLLEESFSQAIENLQHVLPEKEMEKGKSIDPFLEKVVENLVPYQGMEKHNVSEIYEYGIWKDLCHFSHDCIPNCSFTHLKTALFIISTKEIQKGTHLTIDFACFQGARDRKESLSSRYDIFCKCKACEWKEWPKNMKSFEEIMAVTKGLSNVLMIKQLLWAIVRDKKTFLTSYGDEELYKEAMKKFVSVVLMETHWIDLLKLLSFCKVTQVPSICQIAKEAVVTIFMKFFKTNEKESEKLFKNL